MNDHDNGDGQGTVDIITGLAETGNGDQLGWMLIALAAIIVGLLILATIISKRGERERYAGTPRYRRSGRDRR